MKAQFTTICTALLLATSAWAGSTSAEGQKPSDFERMKTLVGTWQGKADMGQGPIEMTIQYRLLAGGTVLEERVFAGTPNEMVTMFYEKDGKLGLTHYCIMGNRPAMWLKSSDARTLTFDLDSTCGINVSKESHMHAMSITFDDPNTITTNCKAIISGTETESKPTVLKRVQS